MADDAKIVVVDGVRYREEDAPKRTRKADIETADAADAEHKMRTPAKKATRSK